MRRAGVSIEPLGAADLEELSRLFAALGLFMPASNLAQFSAPRGASPGIEVVTLGMREAGRLVGTIGWLELPLQLPDGRLTSGRWLVNFHLLPQWRGRGLGRGLESAARGGSGLSLITGGTPHSIPLFEEAGWRLVGEVESWWWSAPCLSPRRALERLSAAGRSVPPGTVAFRRGSGAGSRVVARAGLTGLEGTPWAGVKAREPGGDCGVPRTADYLAFAFGGALRHTISVHSVTVDDRLAGYFALAVRSMHWPLLGADVVDFDALPGSEIPVLAAARRVALACADVVRVRITPRARFVAALEELGARRSPDPGLPLRILDERRTHAEVFDPRLWRVTPGDHDQYRMRTSSQPWVLAPRS